MNEYSVNYRTSKGAGVIWRLKPDEPYAIFVFSKGEVCS
jgi:hypothetical protein